MEPKDIPSKVEEQGQSKLIVSSNQLRNLKSDYFIQKFFGYIPERKSLERLNLNNFNTNNVTDMSLMFGICSSLKELNLNNFNTNNVTNMSWMFCGCSSLKELNLNNFNTNNVTNMWYMFSRCLEELKLKIKGQFKNLKDSFYD